MVKILKTAIAGYGVVGKKRHFFLKKNKKFKVVAICERNFTNKQIDESKKIKFFKNYKELLEENIDVIFICMSNDMAAIVTIESLNKNVHVFCEKPPARNLNELNKVIKVEKSKPNLKLMYGFNHRFHDSIQQAIKIINSKRFGRIINLKGTYGKSKLITFNQTTWRTNRRIAGGGVLLDQGIHMIDLIRYFAGGISEVKSYVSNNFWNFDVEDNIYAILKTNNDIYSMIHSSATQWRHKFILEINLEKGSLILEGILSGSKSYGEEKLTIIKANPKKDNGDPIEKVLKYNNDPSWAKEIKLFSNFILNNKKVSTGSSKEAYDCMKIIYDIYRGDKVWKKKFNL